MARSVVKSLIKNPGGVRPQAKMKQTPMEMSPMDTSLPGGVTGAPKPMRSSAKMPKKIV